MRTVYLFIYITLFSFISFSSANAAAGRADVYKVTMERLELCTDSTCDTNKAICTSSKVVDIASVDAGAEIGDVSLIGVGSKS